MDEDKLLLLKFYLGLAKLSAILNGKREHLKDFSSSQARKLDWNGRNGPTCPSLLQYQSLHSKTGLIRTPVNFCAIQIWRCSEVILNAHRASQPPHSLPYLFIGWPNVVHLPCFSHFCSCYSLLFCRPFNREIGFRNHLWPLDNGGRRRRRRRHRRRRVPISARCFTEDKR